MKKKQKKLGKDAKIAELTWLNGMLKEKVTNANIEIIRMHNLNSSIREREVKRAKELNVLTSAIYLNVVQTFGMEQEDGTKQIRLSLADVRDLESYDIQAARDDKNRELIIRARKK